MGWLYGWDTRQDLERHLLAGGSKQTIKHCWKGNNLWTIQEYQNSQGKAVRVIILFMCRGRNTWNRRSNKIDPDGWGYKDISESMGPIYVNCPLSYLDLVPDPGGHATQWRTRVREHHAAKKLKLTVGQRVMYGGREYTITEDLGRRGYMVDHNYRLPKRLLPSVLIGVQNPRD